MMTYPVEMRILERSGRSEVDYSLIIGDDMGEIVKPLIIIIQRIYRNSREPRKLRQNEKLKAIHN